MASGSSAPSRFHELPLVLFTSLGVAGGGLGAAALLSTPPGGPVPLLSPQEGLVLSVLLGVGLLLSLGHLGRPLRGALALRRVGRSPLSNEVLTLGVALGAGVLGVLLPPSSPLQGVLDLVACLGALAFLLALGLVYHLPAQVAWKGLPAAHPLVMGVTWGLFLRAQGASGQGSFPGMGVLGLALLADLALILLRWRALGRAVRIGETAHPVFFRRRRELLAARVLLSSVLAPGALLGGLEDLAVMVFFVAVLVDRLAFYSLAIRQTTESEVARVESLL